MRILNKNLFIIIAVLFVAKAMAVPLQDPTGVKLENDTYCMVIDDGSGSYEQEGKEVNLVRVNPPETIYLLGYDSKTKQYNPFSSVLPDGTVDAHYAPMPGFTPAIDGIIMNTTKKGYTAGASSYDANLFTSNKTYHIIQIAQTYHVTNSYEYRRIAIISYDPCQSSTTLQDKTLNAIHLATN